MQKNYSIPFKHFLMQYNGSKKSLFFVDFLPENRYLEDVLLLFFVIRVAAINKVTLVMKNKLFVGNLSWSVDDDKLREIFTTYGEIVSANVVKDRDTGKSRGFAFIEYANDESAQAAITALDGKEIDARTVFVSLARPRKE